MDPYHIGLDLGQSQDPTAICVVKTTLEQGADPDFRVGRLQRLPTPYPGVVRHVIAMQNEKHLHRAKIVLDLHPASDRRPPQHETAAAAIRKDKTGVQGKGNVSNSISTACTISLRAPCEGFR
jgi:hypothetical protein